MDLSDSQKATIGEWVSDGLKLSDIQSRLYEEFGISLTYMDARFLIDDLELDLKDQPKSVDNDLGNAPPLAVSETGKSQAVEKENSLSEQGTVSVSLHRIYKTGAVVSGEVVFSDGEKADWSLDQMGRLALDARGEDYQPSESDLLEFQKKLSSLVQNQGY